MTSKSYDHEDFGRLVGEEEGMPLEQMREPAEPDTYEQTILSKRMARKRKAPADEEVLYVIYFCLLFFLLLLLLLLFNKH